jgi:hypothetical protein
MYLQMRSHNNSVGIGMGYWLGSRDFIPGRSKICHFSTSCTTAPGPTHHPIHGYWGGGLFPPGVKLMGHEADHLHLAWRSRMVELYLHSLICLNGKCLIKERDNFTLFYPPFLYK